MWRQTCPRHPHNREGVRNNLSTRYWPGLWASPLSSPSPTAAATSQPSSSYKRARPCRSKAKSLAMAIRMALRPNEGSTRRANDIRGCRADPKHSGNRRRHCRDPGQDVRRHLNTSSAGLLGGGRDRSNSGGHRVGSAGLVCCHAWSRGLPLRTDRSSASRSANTPRMTSRDWLTWVASLNSSVCMPRRSVVVDNSRSLA